MSLIGSVIKITRGGGEGGGRREEGREEGEGRRKGGACSGHLPTPIGPNRQAGSLRGVYRLSSNDFVNKKIV